VISERTGGREDSLWADRRNGSPLEGSFPVAAQRKLVGSLAMVLPGDRDAFRLDETTHPFESSLATSDVRITTRYDDHYIGSSLFSLIHEFGHGLYEHGVDAALERTPLCSGVSLGVHESQSRLWENLVGRSRAFWRWFAPHMQAAFPQQLNGADAEALYRGANRVQASLIRVEADQVTYDLHIIIRFELEQELVTQRLRPADVPDAWNERVERYLGLKVPDDAHGVLQDIHWSEGSFGYFPTYSLGNVLAAQIWQRAAQELPDLEHQIAHGEFTPLASWLRYTLHRHGRKFTPAETIQRVAGGPLDVTPHLEYLRAKFGELYGL
jgi:carboxypeptidase Taq